MSSKRKSSGSAGSGVAVVPARRFPEFAGLPLISVPLGDVTVEGTDRNGSEQPQFEVMGVSKVDGVVPMEVRLIASDATRYKVARRDWFAYNPMRLNIGSIARWQGDADILVSPDYVVFKCKTTGDLQLDPNYLDIFRQSDAWEGFVSEKGDGGVRVRIYYKDLARLQLSLPSIKEQQKIADCLASIDALIAAQRRKVEALKTHKKGLMQQLFPLPERLENGIKIPVEARPCLRFPEFRNAGEWEKVRLDSICGMQAGKSIPASELHEENTGGLFYCYGGNGVRGYVNSFTHSGIYPIIGRQGALCGNVNLAFGDFYATEHAIVVDPFYGISVIWLFYLLDNLSLNQYATGQAQPGLSVDVLSNVMASVPGKEVEQQRIADCLTSLDELIAAETRKLDTLKTHKKGLMQQLFPVTAESD